MEELYVHPLILANYSHAEEEPPMEEHSQDDSRLLSTLFASSGVHSASQHDSIMEASRPEAMLVEREATRVAKEAADALRESRRLARRNDIGTPTWTGRSGGPTRFGSPSRTNGSAIGSESLLARMRHRQALEGSSRNSTAPNSPRRAIHNRMYSLLNRYKNFYLVKGGTASSKELVTRFPDVKGADAIAEFRKMVKQIAEFKDSMWILKEEYI